MRGKSSNGPGRDLLELPAEEFRNGGEDGSILFVDRGQFLVRSRHYFERVPVGAVAAAARNRPYVLRRLGGGKLEQGRDAHFLERGLATRRAADQA